MHCVHVLRPVSFLLKSLSTVYTCILFFLPSSPADCTDCTAAIDAGVGAFLKKRINAYCREDFSSSSERTDQWVDGLSSAERRILMTHFAKKAWDDLCARPEFITTCFKRVGMYNDIHGRKKHLLKVRKCFSYKPPKKGDPKREPLEDDEVFECMQKDQEIARRAGLTKRQKGKRGRGRGTRKGRRGRQRGNRGQGNQS